MKTASFMLLLIKEIGDVFVHVTHMTTVMRTCLVENARDARVNQEMSLMHLTTCYGQHLQRKIVYILLLKFLLWQYF